MKLVSSPIKWVMWSLLAVNAAGGIKLATLLHLLSRLRHVYPPIRLQCVERNNSTVYLLIVR